MVPHDGKTKKYIFLRKMKTHYLITYIQIFKKNKYILFLPHGLAVCIISSSIKLNSHLHKTYASI